MAYRPIKTIKSAQTKEFVDLLEYKAKNPEDMRGIDELRALGIQGNVTTEQVKDANGNPVFDKQGNPVVRNIFTATSTPEYYMKAIPILNKQAPCYFEGCEQIVNAYQEELTQAGGAACTECKKGKIIRKYLMQFRNALPPEEANKVMQPSIPPRVVKNVTTGEVKKMERKAIPYATIRRTIPASLKKAFTSNETERKLFVTTYDQQGKPTGLAELPRPTGGSSE